MGSGGRMPVPSSRGRGMPRGRGPARGGGRMGSSGRSEISASRSSDKYTVDYSAVPDRGMAVASDNVDYGQNENVSSDEASGSSDSDNEVATNWLETSTTSPIGVVDEIDDRSDSEPDGGDVEDWLSTAKELPRIQDIATSACTPPAEVKSPPVGFVPTDDSKRPINPTTIGAEVLKSQDKPKLFVRQPSTGQNANFITPLSPTQPANIRDTTVVKKKKAELPTHNLPHPRPISGDWLNSRTMINNYIILESLGAGSYAEVKLCKEKGTGRLFAMKFIDRDVMHKQAKLNKQPDNLMDIKREIAIMKKLNHPNVLRLFEVMDDPHMNKLFLVLEYMQLGDLLSFKKSQKKLAGATTTVDTVCEPMSDRELHGVALQVLQGLAYLHEQNIVHGDLKPQNLLIGERGVVKIADFGISQNLYGSKQKLLEAMGTPAFMSPEMCSGVQYSGQLADVWAVGATLYMLKFGNPPFIAKSALQVFDKIQNDPLVFPTAIDALLADFLGGIMTKDPMKRLALHEVMMHPWITKERLPPGRQPSPPKPLASSVPITVSVDEINSAIHESPTSSLPAVRVQSQLPFPVSPKGAPLDIITPKCPPSSANGSHKPDASGIPTNTPTNPKCNADLQVLHAEQGSSRRRLTSPTNKRKFVLTNEETHYRSERFAQKRSHPKLVPSGDDALAVSTHGIDVETDSDDGDDENDDVLDDAEAMYQSSNRLDELLLTTLAPTRHTVLPTIKANLSSSLYSNTPQSVTEHAGNSRLRVRMGVSSMQGRRSTQEDRWVVIPNVHAHAEDQAVDAMVRHGEQANSLAFVGLYDGHGGDGCAVLLQERLHVHLFQHMAVPLPEAASLIVTLQQLCVAFDATVCDELYASDSPSGSTATFCILDGTASGALRLVVGHVGDCRALLCRKGKCIPLTSDHRCSSQSEHDKVVESGGSIINNRVNGVLAITRTFGDLEFKGREVKAAQQAAQVYSQESVGTVLDATPDVVIVDVQSDDAFVLFACDGVWEVMTNDVAVAFVQSRLQAHGSIHVAADELAHEAIQRLSSDNVTVVLVQLNSHLVESL
ncbi:hypothetical protein DYB28_003823 [Aphanomyces astaci]|uniref:CAMKK/CAMKK-META protein kinase n=1 Tax=Aphanomyces astaci TaxID=112090 RepID=A0A397CM15_APHAT|nr:hypothetical protein DYB38_007005 [Aphanomyces astaci]RLO03439.1 hypothetical protein DYB28_003823 [Aphanomyces astaci]